jgi:iron complex transport system substrate-binding protein
VSRTIPLRGLAALLTTLLLAGLLAACGSSDDGASSAGSDDGSARSFEPVTLTHAYGETTVEEQPKRVATWGWGSGEAAIALGVTPVAIPASSYGGDKSGLLPWIKEALDKAGDPTPTLLTEGEEPPYEELIKAKPDLILATYSGVTKEQYAKLSKIAKTVAFPDQAWSTPWRDVVTTAGKALGRTAEAQKVLDGIDKEVADAAAAHPEFQGKTIAAVADSGSFYVYRTADPRVGFLEDLGFTIAPSVTKLDTKESTFYYTLSYEQTDKLTSDVLVSYADSPAAAAKFANASSTKAMVQSKKGTIAQITGAPLVSSVSPPTALSLTWGLDEFTAVLSKAAKKAS